MMEAKRYEELKADIAANGQIEAITICEMAMCIEEKNMVIAITSAEDAQDAITDAKIKLGCLYERIGRWIVVNEQKP